MKPNIKLYTLTTVLVLAGQIGFSQLLETTTGVASNGAYNLPIAGSGLGPRTTSHVVPFVLDLNDNSNFTLYPQSVTATFSLRDQQFTGLTYGNGTTNAISTGLVFGAGPTLSTGGTIQQVSPLNSYDKLAATNDPVGAPTNNMFTSDPTSSGVKLGTGIDATGTTFGNDVNSGVALFTAAQVLYDNGAVHNSNTRHYFGELVISFNRYVTNPVIHIAALGASYRYLPAGATNIPANYLSSYYTTELDIQGGLSGTLLSGNTFMNVTGAGAISNEIRNTALRPAGGSTATSGGSFNDFGAATGSVRINGTLQTVVFKVYMRGSDQSDIPWSSNGIGVVTGATRSPLTGDVWYVGVSLQEQTLAPLPSTGVFLKAMLNSNNNVELNWRTLTESNSSRFEIERSADGINYSLVGSKAAAGNSTSELPYGYTDYDMNAALYYYRLKLVDIDGKYTYSNVAQVRKEGGIREVRLYPNPAKDIVNLELSGLKGSYIVNVYNAAGQEMITTKVIVNNPTQYLTISRKNLPAGFYILKIKSADSEKQVFTERLVFE